MQNDLLVNGAGYIHGDTVFMNALIQGSEIFTCTVTFARDLKSFTGPYSISDDKDQVSLSGVLQGIKGECRTYDID